MQTLKSPSRDGKSDNQGLETTNAEIIRLPAGQDNTGLIEGYEWPLIPAGEYSVCYVTHECNLAFGVPRLFIHFKIVDLGEYLNQVVYRAHRIKSFSGKRRKTFKASRRSDYVFEMVSLLNITGRIDRISPALLKGKIIRAYVEPVSKDYRQREKPAALQYSVVRKLLGVEAG